MSRSLEIRELREVSDAARMAIQELVAQLSTSAAPPDKSRLDAIVDSPACRFLVAQELDGPIVGMLTLVLFPIPTGVRAWIEDVVVHRDARGRGLGTQLIREALGIAQAAGARTVDLTSRPDREAANALYLREGFELRNSNVYRVTL